MYNGYRKNLMSCYVIEFKSVPDCFMYTIVLEDARYIYFPFTKKVIDIWDLNFWINFSIYSFAFWLNASLFVFTKLLKPAINYLRTNGLTSVVYLHDSSCIGINYFSCKNSVGNTMKLLRSLGSLINIWQISLIPSTRYKFLRFILDSVQYRWVTYGWKTKVGKTSKVIYFEKILRDKRHYTFNKETNCSISSSRVAMCKIVRKRKSINVIIQFVDYNTIIWL